MIEVYRAADPIQAALLQGLLEAEGIEAAVIGVPPLTLNAYSPMTPETLPRVCVAREEDVARAREIARSFDRSEPLEDVELDREFLALENPDAPEK